MRARAYKGAEAAVWAALELLVYLVKSINIRGLEDLLKSNLEAGFVTPKVLMRGANKCQ